MPTRRSLFSASVKIEGLIDIIFLMALSGTWLGLLGRWHWVLDLFSHFRWQYAVLCLLALGWTLWRRRSRSMQVISLVSLLWNVGEIYRFQGDPVFGRTSGSALKVICLNVLYDNPNHEGVIDYLLSSDADLVFLMEVTPAWTSALNRLKETYPESVLNTDHGNFGLAMFSRRPVLEAQIFQTANSETPSLYARLQHEGKEMVIVGTHPVPPMGAQWAGRRDAQLQDLAQYVASLTLPVLVMGDLNATPWCEGMRRLKEGSKLDFRSPNSSALPTWQAGTVFAIPIDHALCTAPLVISQRKIGPDVGSDHRPQELEIGWAP